MKTAIITVAIALLAAIAWSSWEMNARQARAEKWAAVAVAAAEEQARKDAQEQTEAARADLCRKTRETLKADSIQYATRRQLATLRQIELDNCQ
jgi:hypothetical protein